MSRGRVRTNRGNKKMKKLGIVLTAAAVLAFIAGPALAAKKPAPKPKKLSQGFMEELSKAKWTWQAPKKGKKKK